MQIIRDILRDSQDRIWVVTDFGFVTFDEESKTFKEYKSLEYDSDSIISEDVISLCEDSSGMIWIGTREGISMFKPNDLFVNYKKDPFDDNSLSERNISGIYEDDNGMVWVGTINQGLNIINRSSGEITRVDHTKDEGETLAISNNLVRTIVGNEDAIWIATQNGLDRYDKANNTITRFKEEDGLPNNDTLSVLIDSKGNTWVGTIGGIGIYNNDGTFTDFNEELNKIGIKNTLATSLYEDSDREIWFFAGRENGIVRYDGEKFEAFSVNDDYGKSYSKVFSINSNDDKFLWIGSDSGLIKLEKESKAVEIYTEDDGLANSFIYGILFDSYGNPWVSTNYGISKFDIEKNKFINYDQTDGIQANEFNEYSYFKNKSGEMFFGEINGLTIFTPEDLYEKDFIPKVEIQSIESNSGILNKNDEIMLEYKDNQLRFEFFMPDYSDSRRLQYAYRLIGLDKEWVYSDNNNNANYINLKPGNYTFEVIGRNSSGEWSEPSTIDISISNPPWKTPLAYIVYIITSVLIIIVIWNEMSILENMVKQKTLELNNKLNENEKLYKILLKHEQQKNNYFINLSHELRTPLNLIVSTQQLVDNLNNHTENIPKEKLSHYMNTIKRNSKRLLTLIDNIIFASKIESGNYKLNIAKYDIVYLVEEIALSMKDFIESRDIELIIDPEVEEKVIECDSSDIEKIILNLMSNAVKFTSINGKIQVKVYDLKDKVKITVEDNGIGIDKSKHESIFNRFDQAYNNTSEEYGGSGLGLTLTKQLVELHGGSINIDSELGKGSIFTVILPVKQ